MPEIGTIALLLVPVALAVAFLLWVLWNFLLEDRRFASLLAKHRQKAAAASPHSSLRSISTHQTVFPRA